MLLQVKEYSVDVIDFGAGAPVLFLHSSGMSALQWRGMLSALDSRLGPGWRFVAPNQLGYGRSGPWDPDKPMDFGDEVRFLDALLETLDGPVHLVGHSMGAFLALKLLALRRQADRQWEFASATLIEPVVIGHLKTPQERHYLDEVASMFEAFLKIYEDGDTAAAVEAFTDYWYGPGAWRKIPKAQRLPIFARAPKMYREVKAIWHDMTALDIVEGVTVPVQIVSAEKTTPAAWRMAEILAGALPGTRWQTVPGAGHLLPVTHATDCAKLVADYLGLHSAPAHAARHGWRTKKENDLCD